jgi:hypothetical protein
MATQILDRQREGRRQTWLDGVTVSLSGRVFVLLLILTLIVMTVLYVTGLPLNTAAAPQGIVSYEFAGSVEQARAMLDSWANARAQAGFNLGFDFVYMLLYSTTIAVACGWAGRVLRDRRWPLGALASWLAPGQWLAALFDATENVALTVLLFGTLSEPWPQVAAACATIKFALIIAGLVFALYGVVARFAARPAVQ